MPVTAINPNNSGTITIGPASGTQAEIQCQVVNFTIETDPNTNQQPGTYCAAPVTVPGQSSYFVNMTWLQDWGATPSLSQMMYDNDGALMDFTFTPDDAAVPESTGQFYAQGGNYGGDPGTTWQTQRRMATPTRPDITAQV